MMERVPGAKSRGSYKTRGSLPGFGLSLGYTLVYLSLLERRLEVVADHGILRAVPPLKWNHAVFDLKQVALDPRPEELIKAIRVLGCLLAECLPATHEHRNELSDSPRIELK